MMIVPHVHSWSGGWRKGEGKEWGIGSGQPKQYRLSVGKRLFSKEDLKSPGETRRKGVGESRQMSTRFISHWFRNIHFTSAQKEQIIEKRVVKTVEKEKG